MTRCVVEPVVAHWEDGLDDEPVVRHLFTAAEAPRALGIPAGTVRRWASEGRLQPMGLDDRNRPMYDAEHLRRLRQGLAVEENV